MAHIIKPAAEHNSAGADTGRNEHPQELRRAIHRALYCAVLPGPLGPQPHTKIGT